jgi:cobalt-zinc-cadmium efflux system outer membrane protein
MSRRCPWTRVALATTALATYALFSASSLLARPVTLAEALTQAQEKSPIIRASQAAVTAAEGRARQAGVRPNPELDVEIENALGTGLYRGVGGAELTVAVGQRFERGGKRDARTALAAAEVDLANANLERVRADVARDVRTAFAELTFAQERLELAREATVGATELARTARLMVETGRDPPLRQLRAEAALAEARAAEQGFSAEVQRAARALAVSTGMSEEDLQATGATSGAAGAVAATGVPLVLRIAQAERRAAEARIDLQRSLGVPDITARAGVRGFAESEDVALVGGVSIPLPIRDRNRGNTEAAQADLLAAEARLAQARLDANRELRDAQTLLGAAETRLGALEGAGLEQAREAVRVARLGYAAGRFPLLDVLDAQAALNNLQASIIEARRDRARALAALERARAQ